MAAVEGGDPPDAEPFGRGNHRRVDGAEGEVVVGANKLGDAQPVAGGNRFGDEVPGPEVGEDSNLGTRTEAARQQLDDLRDHQLRNDEGSWFTFEELIACFVMRVARVDVGVERARVDQDCDR